MKKKTISTLIAICVILFNTIPGFAQWQMTAFSSTDQVTSIIGTGGNIFAGTYQTGVFRSLNNGDTWQLTTDPNRQIQVQCLLSNGSYIYAGTYADSMQITNNQGATWSGNLVAGGNCIFDLTVLGSQLVAATAGGTRISDDNGQNWYTTVELLLTISDNFITNVEIVGNTIFCGNTDGVFRFYNNIGWISVSSQLPSEMPNYLKAKGNSLFASYATNGLWVSHNLGTSWTQLIPNHTYNMDVVDSALFILSQGVRYSPDFGISWYDVTYNLINEGVSKIAVINGTVFAGTQSGHIYKIGYSELLNLVSGVEEHSQSSDLLMYPVPSTEQLNICIKNISTTSIQSLVITDINGTCIYSNNDLPLTNTYTIPLNQWKPGCYFITAQCNNGVFHSSFIVSKD